MCVPVILGLAYNPTIQEQKREFPTYQGIRRNIWYSLEWLAATHSFTVSSETKSMYRKNTFNEFHSIKTMIPIFVIIFIPRPSLSAPLLGI